MGMIMVLIVIAVIIGIPVMLYNALVQLKVRVKNAWSQIDVQLKRRYDLIPNLVETVKGYAAHESQTLEKVTQARQQAINATGLKDKAQAENILSGALKSLFAVAESYPNLKANQNFLNLQEELTTTENKISFARQFYNDEVTLYNTAIQTVPKNLIAQWFSFTAEDLWAIENAEERKAPQVKF